METKNKDAKLGVLVYEFLGTAFIMMALIIGDGNYGEMAIGITFAMMCIAYNVSGGHFNPAITVGMFVADIRNLKGNIMPLLLMIIGQFAGAFFGILLGFFAVIDKDYQDKQTDTGETSHASVPGKWVNFYAFVPLDAQKDADTGIVREPSTREWQDDQWTRDWQCFWTILMCSIILVFSFISIKHEKTQLTDNGLLHVIAIHLVLVAIIYVSSQFGGVGWNPALACGYISFAVSQFAYPNIPTDAEFKDEYGFDPPATSINHYLWVYMTAPFFGGAIAGILHIIHSKCAAAKGDKEDVSFADERDALVDAAK